MSCLTHSRWCCSSSVRTIIPWLTVYTICYCFSVCPVKDMKNQYFLLIGDYLSMEREVILYIKIFTSKHYGDSKAVHCTWRYLKPSKLYSQCRVGTRRTCRRYISTVTTVISSWTGSPISHSLLGTVESWLAGKTLRLLRERVVCTQGTFCLRH